MGTTAKKIPRRVAAKAPVVDLASRRSAKRRLSDAKLDPEGFEQITDGLDPAFAVYAHAQALVAMTAEHLASTKEARQFTKIVGDAEDIYMPSFPPMSPVTTSHFAMWSLFDVQFCAKRETMGSWFLRICEENGLPAGLRRLVAAMQASRLGLYVHCGLDSRLVLLREIGAAEPILCHVPAGYSGKSGEIWLARLLPPAAAQFNYHLVATTPYVIRDGSEAAWIAYLARELGRVRSKTSARAMDTTTAIMKFGPTANHWNEYIFCAYVGHCTEAVFLTGIPDIKESLPHA